MMKLCDWQRAWGVGLAVIVLYSLFNWALPVTDPVESNYALTAKEMLLRGDFLTTYIYGHPWYDKPIWTYWMLIGSYSLWGMNDFAARFPSVIAAGLSAVLMYYGVKRMTENSRMALWSSVIMSTFLEFWYISHGVITDQYLFLFSLGTFIFAFLALREDSLRHLCWAYAMAGLAVLDKGPVGLVLPGIILLVYLIGQKQWKQLRLLFHPWGLFVFAVVALPWYLYMYYAHGMDFVEGFLGLHNYIRATISEHPEDNVWYYYIIIWLLGTMPWGPLVGYGLWKAPKNNLYRYALTWSVVTILFYSVMATKYMTYTYISLIGFSVIAAMGLEELWRGQAALRRRSYGLLVFGEVLLLAVILVGAGWKFLPDNHEALLLMVMAVVLLSIVGYRIYYRHQQAVTALGYAVAAILSVYTIAAFLLPPVMHSRSGAELANAYTMKQSDDVYFYGKFSASYVYYSGHSAMLLTYGNKPITDVWAIGKTVMPSEHPSKLVADVYAGTYNADHPAYIYVRTGDVEHFKQYVPEGRCKEVQRLGKNWVLYKAY